MQEEARKPRAQSKVDQLLEHKMAAEALEKKQRRLSMTVLGSHAVVTATSSAVGHADTAAEKRLLKLSQYDAADLEQARLAHKLETMHTELEKLEKAEADALDRKPERRK
jgi:uncharacterized protein YcbK (DUF882 family)